MALFIDGANLYAAAKTLGFEIDFKRLLTEFRSRDTLVRAFYYTVFIEDQEFSSLRALLDWLAYNGFTVVTKPAKEFDDGEGRRRFKRSMGVELAVNAMELVEQSTRLCCFPGTATFARLCKLCSARASALPSCPRLQPSHRVSQTNSVGKQTSLST